MRSQRAANSKLYLGRKKFEELNSQLQETYSQLDSTLSHALRMTASMIETANAIGLEPEKGQKLFRKLTDFSTNVIGSREDLIAAHLEATRIRMRTDQAVTSDGCYPNPFKPSGEEKLKIVA